MYRTFNMSLNQKSTSEDLQDLTDQQAIKNTHYCLNLEKRRQKKLPPRREKTSLHHSSCLAEMSML